MPIYGSNVASDWASCRVCSSKPCSTLPSYHGWWHSSRIHSVGGVLQVGVLQVGCDARIKPESAFQAAFYALIQRERQSGGSTLCTFLEAPSLKHPTSQGAPYAGQENGQPPPPLMTKDYKNRSRVKLLV